MQNIRVNKDALMSTLHKNRQQHMTDYNDAVVEYRKALVTKLEQMLATARTGADVRHSIDVVKPISFVNSYNTAIQMLEMSVDDVIELSQGEFAQYVQDNWAWRDTFASSTLSYKGMA